jgi:hypothetical protein
MSQVSDHWFVRLPNGHVLRAANTTIVRQQVGLGKIPAESAVRRSPDEEWIVLEWTREFADIAGPLLAAKVEKAEKAAKIADEGVDLGGDIRSSSPEAAEAGGLSSRLDPARLPTVGVRGMMHELLAALDATLVRKKLASAALAGLCSGAVMAAAGLPLLEIEGETPWVRWLAAAVLLLAIVNAGAGMITRMTVVELTRMRPARWRDGFTGLVGTTFRMAVAQVLTMGVAACLIAMQRYLPGLLIESTPGSRDTAASAAVIAAGGMLFQIVLWPVFVVALLLPPILVVEKCSVGKALDLWLRLLRVDLGRVFLYEALALGLGLAATLLLALPWVALVTYQPQPELQPAVRFTRWVLTGVALAPLLAYLVVANVFIYINLRYESAPAGRR